jgi:hypothetical protein
MTALLTFLLLSTLFVVYFYFKSTSLKPAPVPVKKEQKRNIN